MLTEKQYTDAKHKQAQIMLILNRFSGDLSGEHNLEKVWKASFHFQDLNYVLENLQEIHDFWFVEGEYAKE